MLGTAWKRWNWLDYVLLPLSVVMIQVVCIAPIFAAVLREPSTGIQDTGFVFWLCLGIMLGGVIVGRLADKNSMGILIVVVGAIAAITVAWMLIIPPGAQDIGAWFSGVLADLFHPRLDKLPIPLVTIIFAVFLWWRGLKTVHIEHSGIIPLFLICMVLQLGIVLLSFKNAGSFSGALLVQMLLFLASSMAAFSFGQIARTIREQRRKVGSTQGIDRYWVATIAGVIVIMILLGMLVAQVVSPRSLSILKPLWDVIIQIFLLIVFVFAYLFFGLLEPLFNQTGGRSTPMTFESFVSSDESLEQLEQSTLEVPPILFQIFQTVVILFGIALVVWLLVRALRRHEKLVEEDGIVEERESVLSIDLIKTQLGGLLNGLRKKKATPFLELGDIQDTRRIVREIYQAVLTQAGVLESPRRRGETPVAYEQTLLTLDPDDREAWDTITEVYDVARYGVQPPTEEQAQLVRQAFARIEPALKKKVESLKSLS